MMDTVAIAQSEYIWFCQLARAVRDFVKHLPVRGGPEFDPIEAVWQEKPASVTWV
jgi:hypothetical protein